MMLKSLRLKSGRELQIDDEAAWEPSVALFETVIKETKNLGATARTSDIVGSTILRQSWYGVMPWIIYDKIQLSLQIMEDKKFLSKFKQDYNEVIIKSVEVICTPFFHQTSLELKESENELLKSQE